LDTYPLDRIRDAPNRAEGGIEHEPADGGALLFRTTAGGGGLIAETALDLQAHVQRRILRQMADHVLGIDDLDVVVSLDVAGSHYARTLPDQGQRGLLDVVHADRDILEVQQDFDDIFL